MAKTYRVVIPYYHEFIVEAKDETEALLVAHSRTGEIICYDDDKAEIEEIKNEKK